MKTIGKKSLSSVIATIVNIVWWIEWIAGSMVLAVLIGMLFMEKNISLKVPVSFSPFTMPKSGDAAANTGGSLTVMDGNFTFPITVNFQNAALLFLLLAATLTIFLTITYQLKVIFSNLKQNNPFDEHNIQRIKNIGLILMLSAFFHFFFNIFIVHYLNTHFKVDSVALTSKFNFSYLAIGMILIIVAEVFRRGASLEQENNLTI